MPSFPSPEPKVSYSNDLDFFKDFKNEFPAIVYNDALTSKSDFLTEHIISPQHIDEFNNETSLPKCDEKEQNILYLYDLLPFNVIYPDDLKWDMDYDNDKIDIEQPSGDMSIIPSLMLAKARIARTSSNFSAGPCLTTDENGVETKVPPKTAQALLARQRERKAKSILLLAIPDEYQLRFHAIKDAKTLWAAIKSRFGGNVEYRGCARKNVLMQNLKIFSLAAKKANGLGYDWSYLAQDEPTEFDFMAYTTNSLGPDTEILNEKVNPVRINGVNIAGQTTVSVVEGNGVTAVKALAGCVWRPKMTDLNNVFKDNSGSWISKRGNPQQALKNKGIFDNGCSRHMTGNKDFLNDYQELDGGLLPLVEVLEVFNPFSVSQMCDKKNSVLFTETECLVLSPDFKLLDESQVLLRVPRKSNMYSFDLKNVVPSGDLTCLFA
ncbi:hypothetical protein Tco_0777828, partial [Tanacetum coccineum]